MKTNSQVIITNQELEDIVFCLESLLLLDPTFLVKDNRVKLLNSLTPMLDKNLELEEE